MREREEGYNGWTNWETWSLFNWMTNDRYIQEYWLDVARECGEDTAFLANVLCEKYAEAMPEVSGMWMDLLTSSFQEIYWFEIAESLIADVKDEGEIK